MGNEIKRDMCPEKYYAKGSVIKDSIPTIKAWLRKNFYIHGNKYCTEDFVKKVTGKALNAKPLIEDLKKRYY